MLTVTDRKRWRAVKWLAAVAVLFAGVVVSGVSVARQDTKEKPSSSPKMQFLGKFDAGVPNAGIYKMYDASDDVVCYILMPDLPMTKRFRKGLCMKVTRLVRSVASR